MPIVLTRATKLDARYKALGGSEHCSACRFYMPQGTCGRIIGPVSPEGWCKYYSREAVQRWSNPGYAGSGGGLPAGSTLNLNFMNPNTLDPRIVFTRASTATYFDATGTMQTAATNGPRWDYNPVTLALRGLLLEPAATNLLLNSAVFGTQSVATTAQVYTLTFYGTGTITKSGTATGALVGTGPQRVSQTFTPTAGTLTLTVTGSVQNAQLETGAYPTSYIATAGATVTRSADIAGLPAPPWYVAGPASLFAEFLFPAPLPAVPVTVREVCALNDGTATNRLVLRGQGSGAATYANFFSTVAGTNVLSAALGTAVADAVSKIAAAWDGSTPRGVLNGGAPISYSQALPGGINTLTLGGNSPGAATGVHLRRVAYWPRALANAELQQVTT